MKIFRVDKKAEMGIGTLIVFIAIVLVAAVAAAVIIDTAGLVQQQAQDTGTRAIADVSTGLKVVNIMGDRWNDTNVLVNRIHTLEIKVRLQAGSPPIWFEELIVEITDGSVEQSLQYRHVTTSYRAMANTTHFTVEPIRDSDLSWRNYQYVTEGTLVKIYINASAIGLNLIVQKHVIIKLIPKRGSATLETFTTPDAYGADRFVQLY